LKNITQSKYGQIASLVKKEIPPDVPGAGPRPPSNAANAEALVAWGETVKHITQIKNKRKTDLAPLVADFLARVDRSFTLSMPADIKALADNPTEFQHVVSIMQQFDRWVDDAIGLIPPEAVISQQAKDLAAAEFASVYQTPNENVEKIRRRNRIFL